MSNPQLEVWKKIVDVQQHFNELELKIRNYALVVTGAFLGLGGYAIKDGGFAMFGSVRFPVAALIVFASTIPLLAFYLMDRYWYHRLLTGAVESGATAERALQEQGVVVDLGDKISKASPINLGCLRVHSRHKMDLFYGLLLAAILILTVILIYAVKPIGKVSTGISDGLISEIVRDGEKKALEICETYVENIVLGLSKKPGSLLQDSTTGQVVVLHDGKWMILPRCVDGGT